MLVLNTTSRRMFTAGEMVNIMAVDVQMIDAFVRRGLYLSSVFVEIIGSLIYLYAVFGYSMFAGIAVLIISTLCNVYASRYQKKLKSKEMVDKDKRVKLLNQILDGIKVM